MASARTKRTALIDRSPGYVAAILISPLATRLPQAVERAHAVAGSGLEGDRYFDRSGTWSDYPNQTGSDLTLIEAEVLDAIGLLGAQTRRNLVTRGIPLKSLIGRRFRVGNVECYAARLCEPCRHLERLTGISVETLIHRGGLRADILCDGAISIGDEIALMNGAAHPLTEDVQAGDLHRRNGASAADTFA